ncbi:chloride channel protein [Pseudonocardia bannensis]|uniref:Chloride channel protein n=1 Tax=Pseudonocardia bannensis TaxID=630973 RepID=A0A848DIA9_9PSEU|nr:chloride channel protein [Pseudonocardia bannensis]NMH92273.1 chloride channel protein [Pseudonocardia bannensis]
MHAAGPADPGALLRSRGYLQLLVLAAVLGIPISAVAYGFLALVSAGQRWVYATLPGALGLGPAPLWWPVVPLLVGGALVGSVIRYLPGRGGHSPADGFRSGGAPEPGELPGVAAAAFVTLVAGAVLGPEAPLIALGGGLAVLVIRLVRRGAAAASTHVVAAAGSFASISTLLGSPLLGAFLLMEAAGIGGAALQLVLLPGLLAAGVGSLIFIGLGSLTGLGTFSLALPDLPPFARPDVVMFGWAIAIGAAAAVAGTAISRLARLARPHIERRILLLTPVVGVFVAGCAVLYAGVTGKNWSDVLFSGQDQLAPLIAGQGGYTVGALLLLLVCKGLAYSASLAAFRGGPVFPAMFLGAAGGVALSHLPGLPLAAGVAVGIGAMCAAMLRLPLTSVLLATLLLGADGLAVMPLVIVGVVVAHVVTARLAPLDRSAATQPAAEPAPGRAPRR